MMKFDKLFNEPHVIDYRNQLLKINQLALWEKYRQLNTTANSGEIVFVGDSITEFNPIEELIESSLKIYNRGIRGITSLQLLDHLEEQILGLKPKIIFLMIGVNDLKTREPQLVFETILTIIKQVKKNLPQSKIYLQSILPINESSRFIRNKNRRSTKSVLILNKLLSEIDNVYWLDLHSLLRDSNNELPERYTTDGVHLTIDAYRIISQKFQEIINQVNYES
ncbi:MAG: GDSL-type esterase/lipase family protein [Streptococcus sp.]|nr:GDSL-type esterase/lipase family protein [Streptococcus sp.]